MNDKKLMEIWENKELSFENLNKYNDLTLEEKSKIFDLILKEEDLK